MIGVGIYGYAMALLAERLPGENHVAHGVIIGFVGWLIMIMMMMLMPMAGAGLFGMSLVIMASMMTRVLHLIFGAVVGWIYGRLLHRRAGVTGVHA